MKSTVIASVMMAMSFGLIGGRTVVDISTGPHHPLSPEFRGMVVKELGYDREKKKIFQDVRSATPNSIRARWSAKITRGGRIICVGGGIAPYEGLLSGSRAYFTPIDWAGQTPNNTCPEGLQRGDVLLANWEHSDGSGLVRSVSKTIRIE